jgi:integrase/recombinase XerD
MGGCVDEQGLAEIRRWVEKLKSYLKAEGYSPETVKAAHYDLNRFLLFLSGREEENLPAITSDTLYAFQMALYGLRRRDGRPYSLSVQSRCLTSVRGFFRYLVRRGVILGDPSGALELPKIKRGLPRGVMTLREVEKVLAQPDVDAPRGLRDRAIMELLYSTGIRNAELRNLALYDINMSEGVLTVRNGKGGKDRVVPFGEIAGRYLDQYVKEARPKILAGHEAKDNVLFVGRDGGKLSCQTLVKHIVERYVKASGIKKHVTPHGFRHTCATHMLKGRASLRHIQALLGHSNLAATQIYTHVEVGDLKKELRRCHPRERPKG